MMGDGVAKGGSFIMFHLKPEALITNNNLNTLIVPSLKNNYKTSKKTLQQGKNQKKIRNPPAS